MINIQFNNSYHNKIMNLTFKRKCYNFDVIIINIIITKKSCQCIFFLK